MPNNTEILSHHFDGEGIAKLIRLLIGELSTSGSTEIEKLNNLSESEVIYHSGRFGIKQSSKVVWLNDIEIDTSVTNITELLNFDPFTDSRSPFKVINLVNIKAILSSLYYQQDSRGPYSDVAAANAAIPLAKRSLGLSVTILVSGVATDYWYRAGVADIDLVEKSASDKFTSDFTVSLGGGKTFGRFLNGQTVPATGKSAKEVILDAAIEYIAPVFTSATMVGQALTVETGSILSGSKTFTWGINQGSDVVTQLDIVDVGNATNLVTNTPNDGTQSVTLISVTKSVPNQTHSWKLVGKKTTPTSGTFDSGLITVTWRNFIFFGASSVDPSTSTEVRTLPQSLFYTGGLTSILNTGTTLLDFYIIIKSTSALVSVFDLDAASATGAVEGQSISYIPQAALVGTSKESSGSIIIRVSISATTTYYLNSQSTFTLGNPQFVGSLLATRIR